MDNTRICKRCSIEQPIGNFIIKRKHKTDILSKSCRDCRNKLKNQWALDNRDKVLEGRRKNYIKNIESHKKYAEEHKEEIKEYKKIYYQENKETILLENKIYRNENKELCNERSKIYRNTHKEQISATKMQPKHRLKSLYRSAKTRLIDCVLSLGEYEAIISNNCFYCNDVFEAKVKFSGGIDRVDNNIGYTVDNCVSCCKICNIIKGNYLSSIEAKVAIDTIINIRLNNINIPNIITNNNDIDVLDEKIINKQFKLAKKEAKRKEREFILSLQEYSLIIMHRCYYCDFKLGSRVYAGSGLDRIDNSKDYLIDNVVSCCKICNSIKNVFLTQGEAKEAIEAVIKFRLQGALE